MKDNENNVGSALEGDEDNTEPVVATPGNDEENDKKTQELIDEMMAEDA